MSECANVYDMAEDGDTRYGFQWGPVAVERLASIKDGRGERRRVLGIYIGDSDNPHRKQALEIYVSPSGRSVRVWRDGKELK
jgi:hypothetical protein